MPRDLRASENMRRSKAKRQAALDRVEFVYPSTPRVAASGPTSFAIKAADPDDQRLIEEALAKRETK